MSDGVGRPSTAPDKKRSGSAQTLSTAQDEQVKRYRALLRLEARRGDGRAWIEPGEVCEMSADEAQLYLDAGYVEEVTEADVAEAGPLAMRGKGE